MKQKTALITGASRGIGEAVARGLVSSGYQVALVARSTDKLKDLERELEGNAISFAADVRNEKEIESLTKTVWDKWGRIDVVVNNAGVLRLGTTEVSYEDFDMQVAVNLRGAFNVLKATVPLLKQQGHGYIFNVSSIAGTVGFEGAGAYAATKFAVRGLNESLYRELAPLGIKVTAICPSWVDTEMVAHSEIPKDRMIQTEDIFKTVEYLLSLSPGVSIKELVVGCADDIV